MTRKKSSIRAARMELEFALVKGDPDKIKRAEGELEAALEEAAERGRASEANDDNKQRGL